MKQVLIFGEDQNDVQSLASLIRAILPKANDVRIKPLRAPVILSRGAASPKRRKMAEEIAVFEKGHTRPGHKVYVVAHRDCDAIEPAHDRVTSALEEELRLAGVREPIAATPAWEMETWWMLFPAALREVRACWRPIDYRTTHVGSFEDSKERLTADLRPIGRDARKRCPDYREEDSIRIARVIASNTEHLENIEARSDSFSAFRSKIEGIGK